MIPRPYQTTLVDRSAAALRDKGNTLAVAPTGAGKTIMLSMLARELSPGRAMVLQHRDELLGQNAAKFNKINPDWPLSIVDRNTKSFSGRAIFGMQLTVTRRTDQIPALDLLVIDEAHHAMAKSYRRIVDAVRDKNPDCMLAGFTATPARGDGQGLRPVFDNVADQITLEDLIAQGFLVKPRTFVVELPGLAEELAKIDKPNSDFSDKYLRQVEGIMNTNPYNEAVVEQWREHARERKTIVFCSTVNHARDLSAAFLAQGVQAACIHGETPAPERTALLKRFDSGDLQVLTNCAVLTEGYDSQPVSCIVLCRPCSQKSTMLQMIGRGLRTVDPELYPGVVKKDCVVLDFGSSLLTHKGFEIKPRLDDREKRGEAPKKECCNCGGEIPFACKECPLCGAKQPSYEDEPEDIGEEKQERWATLTEVDLMKFSPFRWLDLFGGGRVMIACGFDAWVTVCSPDGNTWTALGEVKGERGLKRLMIGEKTVAMAKADDFLRFHEDSDTAKKSRRWLDDPATPKQMELLRRVGYDVADFDYNYTKYSATGHLRFQWNKRAIEGAILS